MDNFDFDDVLNAMANTKSLLDEQKENIIQQRYDEILKSQSQLNATLDEVSRTLQVQVAKNEKELENTKIENKKNAKRSWIQLGLTIGVAVLSIVISTCISLFLR